MPTAHRNRRAKALPAAVLVMIAVLVVRPGPAKALTGPGARWTQQDNGDWPTHSSNPNCGPCLKWDNDLYWVTYFNGFAQATFKRAADGAVSQWSSQPYRSPAFVKDQSKSGDANLVISAKDLSSLGKPCGIEYTSYVLGTRAIYQTRVFLNAAQRFYTDPSVGGCNVTTTLLHEVGHAFAEGHSSLTTDLMYRAARTSNQSVDADAKAMLAAVYGRLPNSGGCNGALHAVTGTASKLAMISRAAKLSAHSAEESPDVSVCGRSLANPASSDPAHMLLPPSIPDLIARRIGSLLDAKPR
jgi:hypothetical protein